MGSSTDLSDQFFTDFVSMCERLACAPIDLLGVAAYESGVRATAHNRNGNASGLWQLMPATARGLGWDVASDPQLEAFRALDPVQQLPWFEKFFAPHRGKLVSAAACYVATFLPALIAHAGDPDFVLCGKDGPLAWAYAANSGFDSQRTGVIRVSDLEAAIDRGRKALGGRWTEIAQRLESVTATAQEAATLDDESAGDEPSDHSSSENALPND